MNEETKEYITTMTHSLNWALVTISKGKVWIDIDEKNETFKMTALDDNKKNLENAKTIQMMFHEAQENKKMDIKKVQKSLDYFDWDIVLLEDDDGSIEFRGKDSFLLVQIAYVMGGMNGSQYAETLRNAIKEKQRIYY